MDNRKKKQTLSRTAHRTRMQSSGTRSTRSTAKKRSSRQPGHGTHVSQSHKSSPVTPDSLHPEVSFTKGMDPAGRRVTDPETLRTADLRSAEPYKPSFSYAEALVTDAELEAFLSDAIQDMIPNVGFGDDPELNQVMPDIQTEDPDLNQDMPDMQTEDPDLNQDMPDMQTDHPDPNQDMPDMQTDHPDPNQDMPDMQTEDPENLQPSPAAAAEDPGKNGGSTPPTAPASVSGEQTGEGEEDPLPENHLSPDTGRHLQGRDAVSQDMVSQNTVSAAGKEARNRALSQIAASLPETGFSGPSARSFVSSAGGSGPSSRNFASSASGPGPSARQVHKDPPAISGENKKPEKILSVKNVVSALLTLAGAAVCILIVHYFHIRSIGITPEIGIFSALADHALKSDSGQEDPAPESAAQAAPSGDDRSSGITDASVPGVRNETDTAYIEPEASAYSPDQSVPDQGEATGFDPASLAPASLDPVSPVPADQDPDYPGQEGVQEIDPAVSDWDSDEEIPEEETEWHPIEEGDPDWDEESEPEEDMEEDDLEEDEEYED